MLGGVLDWLLLHPFTLLALTLGLVLGAAIGRGWALTLPVLAGLVLAIRPELVLGPQPPPGDDLRKLYGLGQAVLAFWCAVGFAGACVGVWWRASRR